MHKIHIKIKGGEEQSVPREIDFVVNENPSKNNRASLLYL